METKRTQTDLAGQTSDSDPDIFQQIAVSDLYSKPKVTKINKPNEKRVRN